MNIRIVRVTVRQPLVAVLVRVRLASIPRECVAMLVMGVVPMAVRVHQLFVDVRVLVPLSKVQPHAAGHEYRRHPKGG